MRLASRSSTRSTSRQYLPNQDPIGKRFQLRERGTSSGSKLSAWRRRRSTSGSASRPRSSSIFRTASSRGPTWCCITESFGDPSSLVAPLREVVQSLDRTLPIYNVRTMEEFYQMRTISIFNVIIGIVAAMGLMGLSLAIVGLYGLVAYATTRRTKEIGIRMAIGAGRTTVFRMILRQGLVARRSSASSSACSLASAPTFAAGRVPQRRHPHRVHGLRAGRPSGVGRDVHRGLSAGAPRGAARSDEGAAIRVRRRMFIRMSIAAALALLALSPHVRSQGSRHI